MSLTHGVRSPRRSLAGLVCLGTLALSGAPALARTPAHHHRAAVVSHHVHARPDVAPPRLGWT